MITRKMIRALAVLLASCTLSVGVPMLGKAAAPPARSPRGTSDTARAGKPAAGGEPLPAGAVARLGTARLRHGERIFFAAYTPDGKALLTAGRDQTVRLWDVATGKELRRFDPGKAVKVEGGRAMLLRPFRVALSSDGKVVAADRGGTVYLWDRRTGKKLHRLQTRQSNVTRLAFSPDGKSLIGFCFDQSILVWQVSTGKVLKRIAKQPFGLGNLDDAVISPDGKRLAWQQIDSFKSTFAVKVMDLTNGKVAATIKAPLGGVQVLTFSTDSKTLAWGTRSCEVVLWDLAAGRERRRWRARGGVAEAITALAFSPDGKALAAGFADRTAALCDVASGKRRHRIGTHAGSRAVVGGPGAVDALAFSANGKRLAASLGGPAIRQFDPATGKEVAGSGAGVCAPVSALGLSAGGRSVLTWGHGEPVRAWDLRTGRQLRQLPLQASTRCAAFSPDGSRFAAAAGKTATLRDSAGKEMRRFGVGESLVVALALSPDGKVVATRGFLDPLVRLWDVPTGKALPPPGDGDPRLPRKGVIVTESTGVLSRDLLFSPDGRYLAGAGPKRQLCLWDMTTGRTAWQVTLAARQSVDRFAFSASSHCLATRNADGTVTLYETATGRKRARLGKADLEGVSGEPTIEIDGLTITATDEHDTPGCLAFSPDGRYLAVAAARARSADIRLWDVRSAREVGRLKGHDGGVVSLLFTPDGKRLLSGGMDTTVLVWDVARLTRGAPARGKLDARVLAALWADLSGKDAGKAFDAIRKLSTSPAQAAALVQKGVRPVAPLAPKKVERLLADLDSDESDVREKAEEALAQLGELAEPGLRKALGKAASAELRQRVRRVLRGLALQGPSAALVRGLRAVELLELAGGRESRRVLEALARGSPAARLTRAARAAGQRLARRTAAD
jgi:WD40 repeat protein